MGRPHTNCRSINSHPSIEPCSEESASVRHKGLPLGSCAHQRIDILLPIQCILARKGLKISQRTLGKAAKISIDSVSRFEKGSSVDRRTLASLQRALLTAGVVFVDECGCGPGIMIKGGLK